MVFATIHSALADSTFTVVIDSLEDSYVDSANPEANYSTEEEIKVGRGTNEYLSYLKFDLERIPDSRNILSAKLRVQCQLSTIGSLVASHYLDDDTWDEETITWNNSPKGWNINASDTKTMKSDTLYFDVTDEVVLAITMTV